MSGFRLNNWIAQGDEIIVEYHNGSKTYGHVAHIGDHYIDMFVGEEEGDFYQIQTVLMTFIKYVQVYKDGRKILVSQDDIVIF